LKDDHKNKSNIALPTWGVVIGLFILLKLVLLVAMRHHPINSDGVLYIVAAQKYADGLWREALAIHPMPLYPLLIAAMQLIVRDWVWAARLLSFLALGLAMIPLYRLAKELFDEHAAWWACLAYSLAPAIHKWTLGVIRGPMFVLAFTWAAYLGYRSIRHPSLGTILLSAAASWLAFLFRIEGLILIIVIPLLLFVYGLREPELRRPLFKGVLVWLLVVLILVGSAVAVVGVKLNNYNNLNKIESQVQALIDYRLLDSYERIYQQLKSLEEETIFPGGRQNYVEIARHYMFLVYWLGLFESYIKVLYPLFLIPLIIALRNHPWRPRAFILVLVAAYLFMIYYHLVARDFIQSRFLFAPAVLLYPWIGAGFVQVWSRLRGGRRLQRLIASVCMAALLCFPLAECIGKMAKVDPAIYQAGKWLSQLPGVEDVKWVSTDRRLPFYAGVGWTFKHFDKDEYSGLEDYALAIGADIVTVRTSQDNKHLIPQMLAFQRCRTIESERTVVAVFCSLAWHAP
jgi:4-amino-4-deoxy-L-arabinose transferase-like glycosyltransferase